MTLYNIESLYDDNENDDDKDLNQDDLDRFKKTLWANFQKKFDEVSLNQQVINEYLTIYRYLRI